MKTLRERGIELVRFDPAERATFERYGKEVSYGLAGDGPGKLFPKAMLDAMYEALATHRAGAAKRSGSAESGR